MTYPRQLMCLALLSLTAAVGCGTNKFEKEVQIEEAALKLAKETLNGGYELISTKELRQMLQDKEEFLLVDAMPAEGSFKKGHIQGAVNFAFPKEVMEEWKDGAVDGGTKEQFEKLLGDTKDRKIVVYCGFVKCARSHNAAIFARELGYTNVYRYAGGIFAWRGSGHALTTE